jgi:hypothetical protein
MEDAMKAIRHSLIVMVSASAALAACASTTPAGHPMLRGADTKRMAQIETAARRAGVEVHWINYPQKTEP